MKIRLDHVVDEPFDWQETLVLAGGELDPLQVLDLGEVTCSGRLSPTPPGYLFQASLSYVRTLRCVRCLAPVEMPVASEVSLLLQVADREAQAEEQELTREDLGIVWLREPVLDTRPILIEQLHLGLPMKTLCREDCAGLCSRCGSDLNQGPCGCEPETDSRWQALKGLKQ